MFLHLSVSHSVHRGWHVWWGVCVAGGGCGRGTCVAGGHAWQGGMCGRGCEWQGGMCGREGACMAGGMHGRGCMAGGMRGRGGACVADTTRYGSAYASYWNAFLFIDMFVINETLENHVENCRNMNIKVAQKLTF